MDAILNLSPALQAALGALVLLQLTLMFFGLRDLIRRPAEELMGGRKWPWALAIVLGEMIGPIVYFAIARVPRVVDVPQAADTGRAAGDRAMVAANLLYGQAEIEARRESGAASPGDEGDAAAAAADERVDQRETPARDGDQQ